MVAFFDDRYYSPLEAAEVLGTTDQKVVAWIHAGELPASNIALKADSQRPRWAIAASDLGKFILSRKHPGVNRKPQRRQRKSQPTNP